MEQHHCCTVCKRNTIKLYRYYGSPLRDEEIFCHAHAPKGHIERQVLVPLVEDSDGLVWGYTSVPEDAIARWKALPEG
jgi:hypothetical protein